MVIHAHTNLLRCRHGAPADAVTHLCTRTAFLCTTTITASTEESGSMKLSAPSLCKVPCTLDAFSAHNALDVRHNSFFLCTCTHHNIGAGMSGVTRPCSDVCMLHVVGVSYTTRTAATLCWPLQCRCPDRAFSKCMHLLSHVAAEQAPQHIHKLQSLDGTHRAIHI
jgi:hypothetical protein